MTFNVGDVVRVNFYCRPGWFFKSGDEGAIVEIKVTASAFPIKIWFSQHMSHGSVDETMIDLVVPAPGLTQTHSSKVVQPLQVGDKVRVISSSPQFFFNRGDEGEIHAINIGMAQPFRVYFPKHNRVGNLELHEIELVTTAFGFTPGAITAGPLLPPLQAGTTTTTGPAGPIGSVGSNGPTGMAPAKRPKVGDRVICIFSKPGWFFKVGDTGTVATIVPNTTLPYEIRFDNTTPYPGAPAWGDDSIFAVYDAGMVGNTNDALLAGALVNASKSKPITKPLFDHHKDREQIKAAPIDWFKLNREFSQ